MNSFSSVFTDEPLTNIPSLGDRSNDSHLTWISIAVTQSLETEINCTLRKIRPTPLPHHCTISLKPKFLTTYVFETDSSRGEFMVICKTRIAVSGTSECLGWQYPAFWLFWQSKCPHGWFYFILTIKPFQAGFWALLIPYHHFVTNLCPAFLPHHPTNVSIPTSTLVHLARFYVLFYGTFYEQQL